MLVGILELHLGLPGVRSLKAKRGVIKGLQQRMRQRFGVAVAEVAFQDHWENAGIGVATVGTDPALIQRVLNQVVEFADGDGDVVVVDYHVDLIS